MVFRAHVKFRVKIRIVLRTGIAISPAWRQLGVGSGTSPEVVSVRWLSALGEFQESARRFRLYVELCSAIQQTRRTLRVELFLATVVGFHGNTAIVLYLANVIRLVLTLVQNERMFCRCPYAEQRMLKSPTPPACTPLFTRTTRPIFP